MKKITVYTDGGVSMKNGVGGWAAILVYPNDKEVVMSGTFLGITNNQMEIWPCIEALSYIEEHENLNHVSVEIISDSQYVVNGSSEWLPRWIAKGWKTKTGPVKNQPLWAAMHTLLGKMKVKFTWVRGHSNNPYNERCDKLAVGAYTKVIEQQKLLNKTHLTNNESSVDSNNI